MRHSGNCLAWTWVILIFYIPFSTKASLTETEVLDFLRSPSGLPKLMLTVNYVPITRTELDQVATDVFKEIKSDRGHTIHLKLIEEYKTRSVLFTREYQNLCLFGGVYDVPVTETFSQRNAISLLAWYNAMDNDARILKKSFCKFDEGLSCPNRQNPTCDCQNELGEIYEDKRCRVKPGYQCRIPDWGDEPGEVRQEVIRMLPAMITKPVFGHSPCVEGAVCKKPNLPLAIPRCVCHDTSKQHCRNNPKVVWKAVTKPADANDLPQDIWWFQNNARKVEKHPCDIDNALQDKMLEVYINYAVAFVSVSTKPESESFQKNLQNFKFCDFRQNLKCDMSIKECQYSETLCARIYGTQFSNNECIRSTGYSYPLNPTDNLPFKKCHKPGNFGKQGHDFRVLDHYNAEGNQGHLCWCENNEGTPRKYGNQCEKNTPFFGRRIDPRIMTMRNSGSYVQKQNNIPNKMELTQHAIYEHLNALEKRMNLPENAPCDIVREKGLKEILIDNFANILPDLEDNVDYTGEIMFWISNLTQSDTLSDLVDQVGPNDICNYRMYEMCDNTCKSHLPPGIIILDDYQFYFKANYSDCSINITLPHIFNPSRKVQACVPNSGCHPNIAKLVLDNVTDDCKNETGGIPFCKCSKNFEIAEDTNTCILSSKPVVNPTDLTTQQIWEECLRRRIRKQLIELKRKQVLLPEQKGCDVRKEQMFYDMEQDYLPYFRDDGTHLEKIHENLTFILKHDRFCKAFDYIKCNPDSKSNQMHYFNEDDTAFPWPGICQCLPGMVITDGACVLADGEECGESWERPPSVPKNTSIPVCSSRRCKKRRNGTWTCNPDPRTKVFVIYDGPPRKSLSYLIFNKAVIFTHIAFLQLLLLVCRNY